MSISVLERRDGINHGEVGCPSGNTYTVDHRARITVEDEADVVALLEVGRPPLFVRQAGHDWPGFWRLVSMDDLPVAPEPAVPPAHIDVPPAPPLADPAAVKLFGGTDPEERAVVARDAVPVVSGDWRAAKQDATPAPAPATPAPGARAACVATTKKGLPCRGFVNPGHRYCLAHGHLEEA